MPYVAICKDRSGCDTAEIRRSQLQPHLDYIDLVADKILAAGPLTLNESDGYNGSLYILDVDSAGDAAELLHQDPYYSSGLFADIEIAPFLPARGSWL